MTADRPPLPDFDSPPVSEVALTVFFEPLNQLQTAHVGLLWQEFRARFPRVEDQPPLPPVIESFGVPSTFNLGIQIHVTASPGIPRSLFVDDQGAELIQFQNDRISHNWRRIVPASDLAPGPVDYPRYGQLRESFSRELDVLAAFLAREELGELNPIQCEITAWFILGGQCVDSFGRRPWKFVASRDVRTAVSQCIKPVGTTLA
jgi:uncharacterized protein (TIGR04255 family)